MRSYSRSRARVPLQTTYKGIQYHAAMPQQKKDLTCFFFVVRVTTYFAKSFSVTP